ncbi:MAG: tetratricopeptide repeat protein [Candidatus Xenobia bacterium]
MPSDTFTRALEMLAAGDPATAEAMLQQALAEAPPEEKASAQNDLGLFLMEAGRLERAADAFEQAARGAGEEQQLAYSLNRGICLLRLGLYETAEQVLRKNAEACKARFGPLNPSHAMALLPLAQALLELGQYPEAWKVNFIASSILSAAGHPRITDSIVIGSELMARQGSTEGLVPQKLLEQMPPELVERVARDLVVRARHCRESALWSVILHDALGALEARLGEDHEALHDVLMALSEMEAARGDSEASLRTLERLYQREAHREEQVHLLLRMALAGQSEALFEQAAKVARKLGRDDLRATVHYNLGQFLVAHQRIDEAVQHLQSAIEMAADPVHGSALGALGLLYHHQGDVEAARPLLEEALQHLAAGSPQAVSVAGHLHGACTCEDPGDAVEASLQAFLTEQLPPDLAHVQVEVVREETRFAVRAIATRELTQEQAVRLGRVLDHAKAQFWRRLQPES